MKKIYNAPQTKVVFVASKGMLCISGPQVISDTSADEKYGMDARENDGWAQSSSVWDD